MKSNADTFADLVGFVNSLDKKINEQDKINSSVQKYLEYLNERITDLAKLVKKAHDETKLTDEQLNILYEIAVKQEERLKKLEKGKKE